MPHTVVELANGARVYRCEGSQDLEPEILMELCNRHAPPTLPEGGVRWAAYFYTYGDYEGDGIAVTGVSRATGMLQDEWAIWPLGHCSCYGPGERVDEPMQKGSGWDSLRCALVYDENIPNRLRVPSDHDYETYKKLFAVIFPDRVFGA